jgi:hypothetical protein
MVEYNICGLLSYDYEYCQPPRLSRILPGASSIIQCELFETYLIMSEGRQVLEPRLEATQQQTARSPENWKMMPFRICGAILGSEVPLHTYIRLLSPDAFEAMK